VINLSTDIVTLQPIYHLVNEALLTLAGGLVLWLTSYAKQWLQAHAAFLGEQTDKTLAESLNRALQNGVQIAMQKADDLEQQYPGVPVKSQIARWAAQYAVDHSPGAVAKFGMDPNDLALKALAYLPPAVQTLEDGSKAPMPLPVEVKTLGAPK
jgi:hypothetical protein